MKAPKDYYLLSGELDHKEHLQLTSEVSLLIEKREVTDLRDRNPQIGIVEGVTDSNPLGLEVGDRVLVHHFTFYRDIGANKGYEIQDHVIYGSKRIFKVSSDRIMFKLVDNTPIVIKDALLASKSIVEAETFGIIYNKEVVRITHGNDKLPCGTEILTEPHALYGIEIGKEKYYKLLENEVIATLINGKLVPFDDTIVVKDIETPEQVLQLVHKPICAYATVIDIADGVTEVQRGDIVYYWPQQGLKHEGYNLIQKGNIIGIRERQSNGFPLKVIA